jgi:FMN-dependent NADH-azoreductase
MNVLHVCASPKPIDESASKQLAAAFFTRLAEKNPDVNVTNVDLYHNPPPYLSYEAYRGLWRPMFEPGYKLTEAEEKAVAYSRAQCELLKEADVLVLTMPMWSCGMPAIMKAWIDQIMAPKVIFTYDVEGPKRLHALRKVILLISSGGVLKEGDAGDALTVQAAAAMNYIGVSDITVAWADGQDPILHHDGSTRKALALEAAQELADEVAEMAQSAPA